MRDDCFRERTTTYSCDALLYSRSLDSFPEHILVIYSRPEKEVSNIAVNLAFLKPGFGRGRGRRGVRRKELNYLELPLQPKISTPPNVHDE